MRVAAWTTMISAIIVWVSPALAGTYAIPTEKLDGQKIYWGNATSFDKPGEVNYETVLKATPEFGQLKKKKIERGTAKYYYLMSQASDRAVRAIIEVGRGAEFDLVAAKGYLASLETPIQAEDLTELVLKNLNEKH